MKKLLLIHFILSSSFFSLSAQDISTIAGTGTPGINGDGSKAVLAQLYVPTDIAIDRAGNVLIADFIGSRIRKIDAATGTISTIAGPSDLSYPSGIALDKDENIFVADLQNNKIKKIMASTGNITTVAGGGIQGYGGDGGPATQALLNNPNDVFIDNEGNIIIADGNNSRVRMINTTTNIISTIAGCGLKSNNPSSPAERGDGGPAITAKIDGPISAKSDNSGNLYIVDYLSSVVRMVNSQTGIITTIAGTGKAGYNGDGIAAVAAQLNTPTDIDLDGQGNIYLSDMQNNRIRKIDAATGIITTIAGNGIKGFSGDANIATEAEIAMPEGLKLDNEGNVYIADSYNSLVREIKYKPASLFAESQKDNNNGDFTISPNPGKGIYYINSLAGKKINQLELYDVNGKLCRMEYTPESFKIDISGMSAGVYFLKINPGTEQFIAKIVKE